MDRVYFSVHPQCYSLTPLFPPLTFSCFSPPGYRYSQRCFFFISFLLFHFSFVCLWPVFSRIFLFCFVILISGLCLHFLPFFLWLFNLYSLQLHLKNPIIRKYFSSYLLLFLFLSSSPTFSSCFDPFNSLPPLILNQYMSFLCLFISSFFFLESSLYVLNLSSLSSFSCSKLKKTSRTVFPPRCVMINEPSHSSASGNNWQRERETAPTLKKTYIIRHKVCLYSFLSCSYFCMFCSLFPLEFVLQIPAPH